MANENGFPFLVGILTEDQAALWTTDRANYFGPVNLAQAIELYYRVRQYSLTFASPVHVNLTGGVTLTWNAETGQYDDAGHLFLEDDTLASDPILVDMTRINAYFTAPPNEQSLQQRGPDLAFASSLEFTGTARTDNFDVTITLDLFTNEYTFLRDDGGPPIVQSWHNYQLQRIGDDYYIPYKATIAADWRNDVFTPRSGGGETTYVGDTAYFLNSPTPTPEGDPPSSVELKSANTSLDITSGTPSGGFDFGIDFILAASKYWTYGGKWNATTGAYVP